MRIIVIFSLLLFSIPALSQKKATMSITEASLSNDTLTIIYSVQNISSESFEYYVPGAGDFKYFLVTVSLFDINKKKNYKYKVLQAGELDNIAVSSNKCAIVPPGNSIVCKLSLGLDSFYIKKKLSGNVSVSLSVFYGYGLIKCTDCTQQILAEDLFAEKNIESGNKFRPVRKAP